jgi:predicted ATPase
MTVIVGENNSGKSTVIEGLRSSTTGAPNFSEGQRNKHTHERVRIPLQSDNEELVISTIPNGGAPAVVTFPSKVNRP